MGMYKKYLSDEKFVQTTNTLGDYQAAVDAALKKNFPDDYNQQRQKLANDFSAKLNQVGIIPPLSNKDEKMVKFSGKYDDLVKFVDDALLKILNTEYPPPKPLRIQTYNDIKDKIEFSSPGLKMNVERDENVKKKIASIYSMGKSYTGHGKTTALGVGVVHAHVGNGDGIAFKWDGDELCIYGYGTKSDSAAAGNSGYAWTTR